MLNIWSFILSFEKIVECSNTYKIYLYKIIYEEHRPCSIGFKSYGTFLNVTV